MVLHARKELAQMVSNGLLIPLCFRGPSLASLHRGFKDAYL